MSNVVIEVPDISCEHCVKTITNALTGFEGVFSVSVSLESKTVEVFYDENFISDSELKQAISDLGFDVNLHP